MAIFTVKVGCNYCNHLNYIGLLKWFNGNEYNGGWKNNQRQGYGVYRYKNGIIYSGEFVGNRKHGKGKIEYPNGKIY